MASAAQIRANRQNSGGSTGPKTGAGKKRAARNAYRHGLTVVTGVNEDCEAVEQLARKIAGDATDEHILECARDAARAQLDLGRVRQLKIAMIERVSAFGALKFRPLFRSIAAEIRYIKRQPFDQPLRWPERVDPLGPMPSQNPELAAEAVRRLLPELRKLDRYEARAIRARDRALHELMLRLKTIH